MSYAYLTAIETENLYPIIKKRSADDLSGAEETAAADMTNGTTSPSGNGNDLNDAKKVKLEKNAPTPPSKVIHIRNIPQYASETEIIQIGLPFGIVTNVLFLKSKNQAFLEMDSIDTASNMVNYFSQHPAQLGGRQVFVQYSNHQELKTDPANQNNQAAQAALQMARALQDSASSGGPNTVLRVIILNKLYPVTIDVLHTIFSKYGTVLKVIMFTKNDTHQALIQMKDSISAQSSKLALHGQNIYNGCCTLQIDFSKLNTLNVKFNNDKSRDYTNPTLPSGPDSGLNLGGAPGMLSSAYASVGGIGPPLTLGAPLHSGGPVLGNYYVHQGAAPLMGSIPNSMGGPLANAAAAAGLAGLPGQAAGLGSVVLVSNLNEEVVTCDALFVLFGVYGDVQRVKILFNKKDCALVQMADPMQAALVAQQHLDRVKLWGKTVRVNMSKHQTVQMPKEGQPDAGLTKDYSGSPLHRFKKPGSKNFQNIFPPSATLHLSNIPPKVTEEQLRELFGQSGTVKNFKFFPKDHKMALIQMEDVEQSINALIALHNYQLAEASHLRVSFTKSTI